MAITSSPFAMMKCWVFFSVRTKLLNTTQTSFGFRGLKIFPTLTVSSCLISLLHDAYPAHNVNCLICAVLTLLLQSTKSCRWEIMCKVWAVYTSLSATPPTPWFLLLTDLERTDSSPLNEPSIGLGNMRLCQCKFRHRMVRGGAWCVCGGGGRHKVPVGARWSDLQPCL